MKMIGHSERVPVDDDTGENCNARMMLAPEGHHVVPGFKAIAARESEKISGGVVDFHRQCDVSAFYIQRDRQDGSASRFTDQKAVLCSHAVIELDLFAWACVARMPATRTDRLML